MIVGGLRLQTDTINRVHRTHVVVCTPAVAYVQTVCELLNLNDYFSDIIIYYIHHIDILCARPAIVASRCETSWRKRHNTYCYLILFVMK